MEMEASVTLPGTGAATGAATGGDGAIGEKEKDGPWTV